jgi:hypothetical protein
MKDKQQCKEVIAKENNFDSFDRAIRYTFNRQLLQSEHNFINKIIDEAMDRYAEQQVKNLNIPAVSNSVKIALLKQLEEFSDYIPAEIYTKKVIEIKSNFNDC